MTGQVLLEVKEEINFAGMIIVKLQGKESFVYVAPEKTQYLYKNANKFLALQERIHTFPAGPIQPGSYSFQFSLDPREVSQKQPSFYL